jgi:hypothetical protein
LRNKGKPVFLVIAILVLILAAPWILWQIQQPKPLQVVIVDKMAPEFSNRSHQGLLWLLNQQKYAKPAESASQPDLVYVADADGVRDNEEMKLIRSAVYDGASLIADFNTFADTTPPEVRKMMYELLGLRWTGWTGRYYKSLAALNDIPEQVIRNYESQSGAEWNFRGSGLVLIGEGNQVIVLEDGKQLRDDGFALRFTQEGQNLSSVKGKHRYYGWFDMIEPTESSDALAYYELNPTPEGGSLLQRFGLSERFPAVVKNENSVYTSYYFAGDWANTERDPFWSRYLGWEKLKGWATFQDNESAIYWDVYVPMMKSILQQISTKERTAPAAPQVASVTGTNLVSRTQGEKLQVYRRGQWEDLYVKGVNMGMALPGKWFTDFPKDETTYLRWFEKISEMHANTIRVYTLMDPSFYRALQIFNERNGESPLWLLQEVWPEEHPADMNYLLPGYHQSYAAEIKHVVDAIHGNAKITERRGRAYGEYTANVAPYVLGYLAGRELEPDEVIETDRSNKGFLYTGKYVGIKAGGTPTESWLAQSIDELLAYEEETYGWQHPAAIVGWPTLDPLPHETEWSGGNHAAPYNDKASIDIRNFTEQKRMKGGLFGAYHIYPNYPDFMNNEPRYDQYSDEEGRLRYGAYLQEFKAVQGGYPAIVAEFGLATGLGNAHWNPDGYHHGSLTEKEQGEGIVRMMKAIHSEGYAGGVVFEWMDEWAKKTWITEPFMIPYERHVFWHNAMDPEQNYGLMAMESVKPKVPQYTAQGEAGLSKVAMSADETYLYLELTADRPISWETEDVIIGLDTYDRDRGEFLYHGENGRGDAAAAVEFRSGMEFLLHIKDSGNALLLATPSYNISRQGYASVPSTTGRFEVIRKKINNEAVLKSGKRIPARYEDSSAMPFGDFSEPQHLIYSEENRLEIRIPWAKLNFTDPTEARVLDNPVSGANRSDAQGPLRTAVTEGIVVSIFLKDTGADTFVQAFSGNEDHPFLWKLDGEPKYRERLKASYPVIQKYFETLK